MKKLSGIMLCATFVFGCVSKPVTAPKVVVPETVSSEIRVAAKQAPSFGDMTPIAVGVSSGTSDVYKLSAERVFALDERGQRIAPLSLDEAMRQAGGATALVAGLKGAGTGALLSGVLGAVTGAVIGAGTGSAGKGAAIGAGVGIATGSIGGLYESKTKTEAETRAQLEGLYFAEQDLKPALPVSGFVFFPKGNYTGVKVLAVRESDGHVQEVFGPMVPDE
jgi:hypothetical protein